MNFISRIIKSINAMRERLKIERHEAMYGPHFNEECALKAVSKMENEDGSRGEHWSLEETTSIANQYGINLKGEKYNKYDWYVALNMIRSDYYRAVVTMTSSDHMFIVLVPLLRFQILMMKLYLKVSFQYQDRADVNQLMCLLAVMESLRNYQCQLSVRLITNTIDNSKEINDLKNDVADIRKMIEDTKKMFMGGFPKPPMPPMPNVPAPMK